ncbi:potassium voltage-gated channel subfamily D member 1-like [Schistocerca gregaria]|uniref:potassium voltage-gated channel subfamily D member 1-like n=1 Tax=Schistocerca gregaria TaxID=7010 RepID=UPI00211EAA56|nr:potassium voltage-gated channel subfamily D member 1-like [Schistocerca gregaria]
MDLSNQRIKLNIGGSKFEVSASTLQRYPNSLLGKMFSPSQLHTIKPDANGEFFFDRNGRLFEFILEFYRSGTLEMPSDLSKKQVLKELEYWQISPSYLEVPKSTSRGYVPVSENGEAADEELDDFSELSPQEQFQKANRLVHRQDVDLIYRGISVLLALLDYLDNAEEESTHVASQQPDALTHTNVLFCIALGYYRLGKLSKAKEYIRRLETGSDDQRLLSIIKTLVEDTSASYTRCGLLLLSLTGLACVVLGKSWWNRRCV